MSPKGDESMELRGDPLKVKRIAQNLIMNSLKYTQEGYVEISWNTETENHWQLVVRDTGPGLNSTNAALFMGNSNLETTSSNASSTEEDKSTREVRMHSEGIGLLTVRHLYELMDAVVEVESEPGFGTTFRIIFPLDFPH